MIRKLKQWRDRAQARKDVAEIYREQVPPREVARLTQWRSGSSDYRRDFVALNQVLSDLDALREDSEMLSAVGKPQRWRSNSKVNDCPQRTDARSRWIWGGCAAMLIAGVAWKVDFGREAVSELKMSRYVTRIGEQKTITLEDGTTVDMNTGTLLTVAFGETERIISLERGQAYFDVTKDPHRPFEVKLGKDRVTVLGTAFDIYRTPRAFRLAVAEGMVVLHGRDQVMNRNAQKVEVADQPLLIQSSLQYRVGKGTVIDRDWGKSKMLVWQESDPAHLSSWRRGIIDFAGATLSEVVKELNRYSGKKILIESQGAMGLKLFATVRIDNIDEALSAIEMSLPIEVTRHFDRVVITRK